MKQAIFKVIRPGMQTTIQDLGRNGYQQFGISPAGAMDTYSMQVANILAGNRTLDAVLEAALIGPQLEALQDMTIAVCGGDFPPMVNGKQISMWKSFLIKKGDVLAVGNGHYGARAYIAISGGIDVPEVLNSKSTFLNAKFGGMEGRSLQKGDILFGHPSIRKPFKSVPPEFIPAYKKELEIRVTIGPHHERFTSPSIQRFFTEKYSVTAQSNRMGLQLSGPKLEHLNGPDIISDAIPLGGIQVPSSGQPIILMSDRQTTGGYTRIGTAISVDIPLLAQAVPGTIVKFSQVSVEEAQALYLKQRKLINLLAVNTK